MVSGLAQFGDFCRVYPEPQGKKVKSARTSRESWQNGQSAIMNGTAMADYSASLAIPFLPTSAPMAEAPPELKLRLYPHQRRSLARMLYIENSLNEGTFGVFTLEIF